jgi:erythromycin esterase-like protein
MTPSRMEDDMADSLSSRLGSVVQVLASHEKFDAVLERIGDAEVVLLGEATHGTHEFYLYRAQLSKRLIVDKGFDAIAVEADWPDALCIDRHVRLRDGHDADGYAGALKALATFQRFPRWMWRNTETLKLMRWLRAHNAKPENEARRAGFFGLDLYSLRRSMDAVVTYLDRVDPEAARRARARYSCFDHLADDPQHYGYATTFGLSDDCEDEVVQQLLQLMEHDRARLAAHDADEAFFAEQNARVARNAEAYYRAMFQGRNKSWNLRDTHMADTLTALREHLSAREGRPARVVVWAHNSHIGDARATEMGEDGQLNLGQLARERFGSSCYLLGFTTHAGTVCAASDWDGAVEQKRILPSRPDSFERLLHDCGADNFFLALRELRDREDLALGRRLERAIGVIYLPQSERVSHYFHADLARQFDGVLHVDVTRPLTPLDEGAPAEQERAPETFPSGI